MKMGSKKEARGGWMRVKRIFAIFSGLMYNGPPTKRNCFANVNIE